MDGVVLFEGRRDEARKRQDVVPQAIVRRGGAGEPLRARGHDLIGPGVQEAARIRLIGPSANVLEPPFEGAHHAVVVRRPAAVLVTPDALFQQMHGRRTTDYSGGPASAANLALVVPPGLPQWNAQVTYRVERTVRERVPFSGPVEQFSGLVEYIFQHGETPNIGGHAGEYHRVLHTVNKGSAVGSNWRSALLSALGTVKGYYHFPLRVSFFKIAESFSHSA